MKTQAFLALVEKTLTAQQDYYKAKRNSDPRAKDLLIAAKGLEKQCWAVIKEGRLEPDAPTVNVYTAEEYQEQLQLIDLLAAEERPITTNSLDTEDNNER